MLQLISGLLVTFVKYSQCANRNQIFLPNLNSIDETKGFINSNDVAVIGFFSDISSTWATNYMEAVDHI